MVGDPPALPLSYTTLETFVAKISNVRSDIMWTPLAQSTPVSITEYPTLAQLSRRFTLNREQHLMFIYAGLAVLSAFTTDWDQFPTSTFQVQTYNGQTQFIGFLTGAAGTGKSRVIEALLELAAAWGRPDAVQTVAQSGIAADNVNGMTIHRYNGFDVHANMSIGRISRERYERSFKCVMLIVDEFCQTSQELIGKHLANQKHVLNKPSELAAGKHMLLAGDHMQLSPIGTRMFTPLFEQTTPQPDDPPLSAKEAKAKLKDVQKDVYHALALELYLAINCVVTLKEVPRFNSNPEWGEVLGRIRFGEYNQVDLDYINAHAYCPNSPIQPCSNDALQIDAFNGFCPIILTSNSLRQHYNTILIGQLATRNKAIVYQVDAQLYGLGSKSITLTKRHALRNLQDDKCARLATVLWLILGGPYSGTRNIPGIMCNGTLGHVVGIQHHPNNVFTSINSTEQHYVILKCSHMPEVIYWRHMRDNGKIVVPGMPSSVVPVRPLDKVSVTVSLPSRSFTIKITQFPLVSCMALLVDKLQGITIHKAVTGQLRPSSRRSPQRTSQYVAFSRVRQVWTLRLPQRLTIENCAYFKPDRALVEEQLRIESHSCVEEDFARLMQGSLNLDSKQRMQ